MTQELQNVSVSELKEACETSFSTFAYLMQGDEWFDKVHGRLCDFLQYHTEHVEGDIKILVVMPRGALKTTIVTKLFPIWLTLRDPNLRTLIATNTHPNARKKLADVRGIYDSNKTFRSLWPELLPDRNCQWSDEAATINRSQTFPEASFEIAGRKTKKEGTHYNIIIEDDTTAPEEAERGVDVVVPSMTEIDRAIGWHRQATYLMVPKGLRMRIVVTTRWAEYDLVSFIQEKERYKVFDVPAVDEEGESRFQIFYSKESLQSIKEQVGPYMYSCLYLNIPLDPSLRVFKDEWLHWIEPREVPQEGFFSVAIDPAISEKEESCETAITKVRHVMKQGRQPFQYWIKDIHEHLNPAETVKKALDMVEEDLENTKYILVEVNAYQAALKYALRDEMARREIRVNLLPVISRQKKDIRIFALEPMFANSRILLVKGLTPQVESQLRQFPHGKLIDIIDCFSMHIKVYKGEKRFYPLEEKKAVDPFSFEEVMKEIHEGFKIRTGMAGSLKTGLDRNDDSIYNPLETGLGIETDVLAGYLNERNN